MPGDYLVAGAIVVASYIISRSSKGAPRAEPKAAVDCAKGIFSKQRAAAPKQQRLGTQLLVRINCDDGSGRGSRDPAYGHLLTCCLILNETVPPGVYLALTFVAAQPRVNGTAMWIGSSSASISVCSAVA